VDHDGVTQMVTAMMKRMQARRRAESVFTSVMIGAAWSAMACAGSDDQKHIVFPSYEAETFCARTATRSPQSASDCLATELAFKWTLSRVWLHLTGQEKDQAEICANTVAFTFPETGSFRALAECVSGLSNVNE
jgi:hypothetical protein